MKENKIYSVVECGGIGWEDSYETNIRAFRDKTKAENLKKELEKLYENPHLFEDPKEYEIWEDVTSSVDNSLCEKFNQFLDEKGISHISNNQTKKEWEIIREYIQTVEPEIRLQETYQVLEEQYPGRWTKEEIKKMYAWEECGGYPPTFRIDEIPFEE